jgi:hypothetical protein
MAYIRTPEIREKIRQSLLGNIPWNKGKKRPPFSKEWKEKLRLHNIGNKSHLGEVHDEAYKKRMSESCKGIKKHAGFGKKVSKALRGKPKSDEHKRNLSIAHIGKQAKEKNPNWNPDRAGVIARSGGRRCYEFFKWTKDVKDRDGWKCKIGNKDCHGRLESHHILPWSKYPELWYDINNGITLCKFHHYATRKKEELMSPYFKELLKQK